MISENEISFKKINDFENLRIKSSSPDTLKGEENLNLIIKDFNNDKTHSIIINEKKKTVTFAQNIKKEEKIINKTIIPRSSSIINLNLSKKEKNVNKKIEKSFKIKKFEIPILKNPENKLLPSIPKYFDDPESGQYGIRCICETDNQQCLLIECDKCGFWVHGPCVCIAKPPKTFLCPFCSNKPIRCKCNDSKKYDIPIIQCTNCKYWVHKSCHEINFGKIPPVFRCYQCGNLEFAIPPPYLTSNDTNISDKTIFLDSNYFEVLENIPIGQFRNFLTADLNRFEISLYQTITRYFTNFIQPLFELNIEFWNLLINKLILLLNSDKKTILTLIDISTKKFLYDNTIPIYLEKRKTIEISDSIINFLDTIDLPQINLKNSHNLYINNDGYVYSKEPIEENSFIIDLPGFLMHTDELFCDNGIPLSSIVIPNFDLIIDLEETSLNYIHKISRSFHYNCIPKLFKFENKIHVGLFGIKPFSPIKEEKYYKPKNNMKLILPFDGNLPYKIPLNEWKEKKINNFKKKNLIHNDDNLKPLTLLSSFYDDNINPIPLQIINDKNISIKSKVQSIIRKKEIKSYNYDNI